MKIRWAPLAHVDTATAGDLNAVVVTRGWLIDAADVLSILIAPFILRLATLAVVVTLWARASPVRGANARGLGRLDPAGLRWLTLFIAITVGIGGIVSTAVKALVARPRPSVAEPVATAHGTSFPSGHVVGVTVAVLVGLTALAAVHGRRPTVGVAAPTALIIAAVGGARLTLGVHYLSDVIGGCLLAVAWTATMIAVFTRRIFKGSSSVRPKSDRQ
ncbi:phosphatase PAP2 family protein [Frankia sp. Cr2]|uniref:phosphatase PAP2 family protein n=1 Tax=Frankia sp. Cr2 TaxID=3073932 RepID=UPI002AD4BEE2|nr:phosphatase PAP2 family protein [Frankia sp. Cr2]